MDTIITVLYYIAYFALTAPFILILVKVNVDFIREGLKDLGVDKWLKSVRENYLANRSNRLTLLDIIE